MRTGDGSCGPIACVSSDYLFRRIACNRFHTCTAAASRALYEYVRIVSIVIFIYMYLGHLPVAICLRRSAGWLKRWPQVGHILRLEWEAEEEPKENAEVETDGGALFPLPPGGCGDTFCSLMRKLMLSLSSRLPRPPPLPFAFLFAIISGGIEKHIE